MTKETTRKTAGLSLAIIAATVAVLYLMGRSWWCSCGSPVPWSWNIWSSHNSQHFLDPYSFSHVLHGLLFFAALCLLPKRVPIHVRFLIALTIEGLWEILENSPIIIERYRAATISLDYYGDSIANSISDMLACAIGFWIAASLRWWWSVAVFCAVEIVLVMSIRDCLILNIIMLCCPIEAIKQWQVK
jgi:hypothetical protein